MEQTENITAIEQSPQDNPESKTGKKTYNIEGQNISVAWKVYSPEPNPEKIPNEIIDPKKAIIFLPGWSILQNASSLERTGKELADYSRRNAYMMDTTTESIAGGNLTEEAKALVEFVKENGFNNLTLIGNSQGGAEAIHLIALLQEQYPDIKLEGLGLLDPVTINEQPRRKFVLNYARDLAKTELGLLHHPRMGENSHVYSQNAKYAKDGITGILKYVLHAKLAGWLPKIWNEVTEMAKQNSDLAKVKCPVVIMQGADDRISDARFTTPKNPLNPSEGYIGDAEDQKLHAEKWQERKAEVDTQFPNLTDEERAKMLRPSDQDETGYKDIKDERAYYTNLLFPNSVHTELIVPTKMGVHNVSYSRPGAASAIIRRIKEVHRPPSTSVLKQVA